MVLPWLKPLTRSLSIQNMQMSILRKFEDDPHNPANHLILQIQSKFIQVLYIQAVMTHFM